MTEVGIVAEQRTRELRRSVLRPQLAPGAPLPGDEVPDGVHFAATDEHDTVLCTCFVYPEACPWLPGRPAWHLRQMATAPDHRGHGHGAAVLAAAVEHVRAQDADVLWCNAREAAIGFYERQGFRPHGPIFTDARRVIAHLRMWRELGATPDPS